MTKHIRIVEVGPRDGLQNEKNPITLEKKISFVQDLFSSGLTEVELTSFVRSDKIPQLTDAKELTQEMNHLGLIDKCWVLVPNAKGVEIALTLGIKKFAFFTSASELFNKKNINCTVDESVTRITDALKNLQGSQYRKRGYLSMVFGCPYEGEVPFEKSLKLVNRLMDLGMNEISLGDTIGIAGPEKVKDCIKIFKTILNLDQLAMHFHDTKGLALVNIFESMNSGVTAFDSSAAGLGGCPYAFGATGNVATEDVVYLCQQLGFKTGVELKKLVNASQDILQFLQKSSLSKVHQFFLKEISHEKK